VSDINLNQRPNDVGVRDAIHTALISVEAAEDIKPAQHVGLLIDGTVSPNAEQLIGIANPFETETIKRGSLFYLCLYPNTIQDMRHHWKHPAFDKSIEYDKKRMVEQSQQWLEDFAKTIHYYGKMSYDSLISELDAFQEHQCFGDDSLRDEIWEHRHEIWKHYEVVSGTEVDDDIKTSDGYRCAC